MIDHETPNLIHILYHLAIMLLVTGSILACIHLALWIAMRRHKVKDRDESKDMLNRQQRRRSLAKNNKGEKSY